MFVSPRSVILCALIAAIFLSPIVVGAVDVHSSAPVEILLLAFAAYAFSSAYRQLLKKILLVLLSVCFAVTLFDLAARPLLVFFFEVRPSEHFIRRWAPLPQLQRYEAGVNFVGETYGDLAAVSGQRDWREWRQVRFVTDEYGFRNETPRTGSEARPLDVIVLADSFGVAAGTSQEEILSSWLERDFGLHVYNLSVSRENPLQQYANLKIEGERLNTREGTCVLWLIFPGNDLDEPYYRELENPQPVWPGPFKRFANSIGDFRSRSPVRRLWSRDGSGQVIERTLVDGRRILFHETYAQRRSRSAEDIKQHPNFESLKSTLGAMERLAADRRLTVAVALVPSKEEVYSWVLDGAPPWSTDERLSYFSVVLRELCEQHGFRFLDLKPALVEASRRDYEKSGALVWWSDDTHWNGNGQRIAAATLYEHLLRDILQR